MNRQEQIAKDMAALRLSGSASAERLPAAWNRAKDWREYVRAFPLQTVAAAALVGFTVVPKRKAVDERPQSQSGSGNEGRRDVRHADSSSMKPEKGFMGSFVAPARTWAVALATQTIHRMLMNQFNQLSTRIFTDERQSNNEGHTAHGFGHADGRDSESPRAVGGRNGHYNGHRRSD
jgi:hypothetical protein